MPNVSEDKYEKDMLQVNAKLDKIQTSLTEINTSLFSRRGLVDSVERIEKRTEILEQHSVMFKEFKAKVITIAAIISLAFSSVVLLVRSWFFK